MPNYNAVEAAEGRRCAREAAARQEDSRGNPDNEITPSSETSSDDTDAAQPSEPEDRRTENTNAPTRNSIFTIPFSTPINQPAAVQINQPAHVPTINPNLVILSLLAQTPQLTSALEEIRDAVRTYNYAVTDNTGMIGPAELDTFYADVRNRAWDFALALIAWFADTLR